MPEKERTSQGAATPRPRTRAAMCAVALGLALSAAGCGGSLYKVKPKVDAPVEGGRGAAAAGVSVRAAPMLADEESQELFEANLPLGGLLPVRLEVRNDGPAQIPFRKVRFRLRDAEGREWKLRSAKQAASRVLTANQIYLYNPNSRRRFEEAMAAHAFDTAAPLDAGGLRRGLLFFQAPKNGPVESPRGLSLTIEGLPQAVEVIFD